MAKSGFWDDVGHGVGYFFGFVLGAICLSIIVAFVLLGLALLAIIS